MLRFLTSVSQDNRNKNKNKQMRPNQTCKLLHSKGNDKQNENTTCRMGENICNLLQQYLQHCDVTDKGLISKIHKHHTTQQ